jgi:hypothetical protein
MKANKDKGISRIDLEKKRLHGWYVRVSFNGEELCKFFPDCKCGNKRRFPRGEIVQQSAAGFCRFSPENRMICLGYVV